MLYHEKIFQQELQSEKRKIEKLQWRHNDNMALVSKLRDEIQAQAAKLKDCENDVKELKNLVNCLLFSPESLLTKELAVEWNKKYQSSIVIVGEGEDEKLKEKV